MIVIFESTVDDQKLRCEMSSDTMRKSRVLFEAKSSKKTTKNLNSIRVQVSVPLPVIAHVAKYLLEPQMVTHTFPTGSKFEDTVQPWEIAWLRTIKPDKLIQVLSVGTSLQINDLCTLIYVFLQDMRNTDKYSGRHYSPAEIENINSMF